MPQPPFCRALPPMPFRSPASQTDVAGMDALTNCPYPRVGSGRIPIDLGKNPDRAPSVYSQLEGDPRQQSGPRYFLNMMIAYHGRSCVPSNIFQKCSEQRMSRYCRKNEIRKLPWPLIAQPVLKPGADMVLDSEDAGRSGQQWFARSIRNHVDIGVHSAVKVDGKISEEVDTLDHAWKRIECRKPRRRPAGYKTSYGRIIVESVIPLRMVSDPASAPIGIRHRQIRRPPRLMKDFWNFRHGLERISRTFSCKASTILVTISVQVLRPYTFVLRAINLRRVSPLKRL
jgi:hypothetical protein